jgi:excisionase family DNA binding protein
MKAHGNAADPAVTPWRTVKQAAEYAQVSDDTIYGAIRDGQLRAVRVRKRRQLRIHLTWIDAWLDDPAELINADAPGPPANLPGRAYNGRH